METKTEAIRHVRSNADTPAPTYQPHVQAWHDLCARHPFLWTITCSDLHESMPPAAMKSDDFLRLLGSLLSGPQRRLLRELLLDLLADDMKEIAQWYGEEKA